MKKDPYEQGRADAVASRAAAGLPTPVEDVATLRALAVILDHAPKPPPQAAVNRRRAPLGEATRRAAGTP